MSQQTINVGAAPNDGTGTPLRTAFQYTNSNFTELYTAVGPSGNNIVVPGNATITGDLTVDTSTLKVDSANNRVGIGTASPTQVLTVRGNVLTTAAAGTDSYANVSTDGVQNSYLGFNNSGSTNAAGASNNNTYIGNGNNYGTQIVGNSNILASFGTTGVFNWYDGAGGTRMTLNSTGLGVGDAPAANTRLTLGSVNPTGLNLAFKTTGVTTGRVHTYLGNTSGDLLSGIEGSTAGQTLTGSAAYSGFIGTFTNNPFYLVSNGLIRATIDSSGNVGIGVTPSAWWSSAKALQIGSGAYFSGRTASVDVVEVGANQYINSSVQRIYIANGYASRYQQDGGVHQWFNAPSGTAGNAITFTQAMTLDASGNLNLGVTSPLINTTRRLSVSGTVAAALQSTGAATVETINVWHTATSGDNVFVDFDTEAAVTSRGSISYNRAGGLVAYNTTSDYRAKDIIGAVVDSGSVVDALKVYTGKMKGATIERPMLIAHEAQEVAPYCVTGEKDAVDADGKPIYQQMDASALVPLLIAEIQSLRARVQTLETR